MSTKQYSKEQNIHLSNLPYIIGKENPNFLTYIHDTYQCIIKFELPYYNDPLSGPCKLIIQSMNNNIENVENAMNELNKKLVNIPINSININSKLINLS